MHVEPVKKQSLTAVYRGITKMIKSFEEGEFEAGQSSGLIKEILSVEQVMKKLLNEIDEANSRNQKVIAV